MSLKGTKQEKTVVLHSLGYKYNTVIFSTQYLKTILVDLLCHLILVRSLPPGHLLPNITNTEDGVLSRLQSPGTNLSTWWCFSECWICIHSLRHMVPCAINWHFVCPSFGKDKNIHEVKNSFHIVYRLICHIGTYARHTHLHLATIFGKLIVPLCQMTRVLYVG